jgi:SAM-dependent methyltransferase
MGSRAFEARDRNREVTRERFAYRRCVSCHTLFLSEIPDDLQRYYGGGYYPFGHDGRPLWQGNPLRERAESFRVERLRALTNAGRLIDVGAGTGGFVAAAHAAGFDVTAVEMDPRCCLYIEREIGVAVVQSDEPTRTLAKLPSAGVITLWHVLEHLGDPTATLRAAVEKLDFGGVLAVAVPNTCSLQFRLLRTRWAHLDAPRHLVLARPQIIVGEMQRLGMSCLETFTNDPDGQECDLFGWLNAIRLRPAAGPASERMQMAAFALRRLAAPIERRGRRGTAVTLIFRKGAGAGRRRRGAEL